MLQLKKTLVRYSKQKQIQKRCISGRQKLFSGGNGKVKDAQTQLGHACFATKKKKKKKSIPSKYRRSVTSRPDSECTF